MKTSRNVSLIVAQTGSLVIGVAFVALVLRIYRSEEDLRVLAFLLMMGTACGTALLTVRFAWSFRIAAIAAVVAGSLLERWAL